MKNERSVEEKHSTDDADWGYKDEKVEEEKDDLEPVAIDEPKQETTYERP